MRRAAGKKPNRRRTGPREDPPPHVLRDYALLADGQRAVILGPHGDCAWMCFPRFSDPALFASLIGSGGHYVVRPVDRYVWGGYYEDGTLIWNSRWVTESGAIESRETLVYPGASDRVVLLRRVRAFDAEGALDVTLDPMTDYGRRPFGQWRQVDDHWEASASDVVVRWWGAEQARVERVEDHERLTMRLCLGPDRPCDLVLEVAVRGDDAIGIAARPDSGKLWRDTAEAWERAVPACEGITAARDVRRSFAVLRGMTGPDGGTVAAATTSLPERAGGARNYDYRYVWVRDTCYVGRAGAVLPGGADMLDDAVRWVRDRLLADGENLAPAYRPDGTAVPAERKLDLPGYPGGSDVTGNRARDQFQLDSFGEVLLLLALAAERGRLDPSGWEAAHVAARTIERHWTEPEAGIWELDPQVWAHSRLICVAGLRALCAAGAPSSWSQRCLALADRILAQVASDCAHPSGRWQRAVGDERVDASLLLAEIRGAVPAGDPRSAATRRAVEDELTDDEYVYRYRSPGAPLGAEEGAFLICNFWMALASIGCGAPMHGLRWFERARSAAGSPGLLAEEFDVVQHQLRGNLPQAFVHALLIETAVHFSVDHDV